jgi:hypothetical protein
MNLATPARPYLPTATGEEREMTKITAAITTSVDGYVTGPNDGPAQGLGEGGERLHYWVMGGPWTYDDEGRGEATGEDAAWLSEKFAGFSDSLELEHLGVSQSRYATFIDYRVKRGRP